jgi:putative membrane protein
MEMQKKLIFIGLCCCAVCGFAVVAQTGGQTAGGNDQQFVDFAAQTDMMEAHLGQLAADQASAQGVKDYAQMLVTDHTNDYQQLSQAAGKAGDNVPKGLDAQHNRMIAPFEKLKGKAFDHRYIQEMVTGHTQAIARYRKEADSGQNADIKAYASQALPTLQKHLDGAKDLQKAK